MQPVRKRKRRRLRAERSSFARLRKQAEAAKARSEQRAERLDLKSAGDVVRRISVSPTSNNETQLVEYEDGSCFLKMSFTYAGDRQQRFIRCLIPVVWVREQ